MRILGYKVRRLLAAQRGSALRELHARLGSRLLACVVAAASGLLLAPGAACAQTEGPGWELYARTYPTNLIPAKSAEENSGTIIVHVFNVGAGPATTGPGDSQPITVTDVLPPGVLAREAGELSKLSEAEDNFGVDPTIGHKLWDCTGNGGGPGSGVAGASVVTCTNDPVGLPQIEGGGGMPSMSWVNGPDKQPELAIAVQASTEASGLTNQVTIAGGGAPTPASTVDQFAVSSAPAPFGISGWDAWASNADGTIDTQAGSHPYEMTFVFDVNTADKDEAQDRQGYVSGTDIRSVEAQMPAGLVADPLAVPQCTRLLLAREECPQASEVGLDEVYPIFDDETVSGRVFNMVPPPGVTAEFGVNYEGNITYFDAGVRTGGDYGISVRVNNISQRIVRKNILTLWGVPGEASHNRWRSGMQGGCTQAEMETAVSFSLGSPNYCAQPQAPLLKPLLTLPTSCGAPLSYKFRVLSGWQDPSAKAEATVLAHNAQDEPVGLTGCGDLTFEPRITTSPDTAKADTPAGLTVEVRPSIGGLQERGSLDASDMQDTTVVLPPGIVVNAGQAAGLQACGAAEDGLTTQAESERGEENDGPPHCPNASRIGTVQIKSPLIEGAAEKEFDGDMYVLQSNPPELRVLLSASADGVNVKLVGVVDLNPSTGQVEARFEGTPELPFTVFKLSFSGGPQAALVTPAQCGVYTSAADFKPWAAPLVQNFQSDARLAIVEGPEGSPCPPAQLPFTPSLIAGATTDHAGESTDFSLLLRREDAQQRIQRLQFKLPPGLIGMLSEVQPCQEPQAGSGSCPASARIGHASIAAGPGPYPLIVPQPGEPEAPIYLTGPYDGAPFGLSIVVSVLAGPFDLGTIVERAKIEIDPTTAQITITMDPLPQIVDGVPTDVRAVNAVIDRPGFIFNPTSCDPMSFSGTAWGTPPPGIAEPGDSVAIASRFQVGGCHELKFESKMSVTASRQTSKNGGISFRLRLTRGSGPKSGQANFSIVKVELPRRIPTRLTAVQQACLAAQFQSNPAGCPPRSVVGHARVVTSILPVPLEGPVYFVSHGGEAFPNLVLVLQGDNVTIDVVTETSITKAGITTSTIKSLPDAPFSTFEMVLPQGPNSALAANGNLCKNTGSLALPIEFVAQNGVRLKQSTKVSVSGCPKAGKSARRGKPAHKKRGRK